MNQPSKDHKPTDGLSTRMRHNSHFSQIAVALGMVLLLAILLEFLGGA